MKNLDLETKYINFIKNTILSVLSNVEIFIFGSRTQGKALEYSDIDIALRCDSEIDINKILQLKSKFSNSTFPYKVDIVDLNSVDEKFLEIIKNDLVKIGD